MIDCYSATSLYGSATRNLLEDKYECSHCGYSLPAHMLESYQCECGSFDFEFVEGNFRQEEFNWSRHLKHEEYKARQKERRLAKMQIVA